MSKHQQVIRSTQAGAPALQIHWPEKTPHWRALAPGHATMDVRIEAAGRAVCFDCAEWANMGGSKRTMLTLDADAARALRDFLNEHFKTDAP